MSNNITNLLGYTGIVTLSRYVKDKKFELAKIHNRGNKALFDFLADCFTGDYDSAKFSRPRKLLLLNYEIKSDKTEQFDIASTGFIYLIAEPKKVLNGASCTVQYSFMVHRDQFLTNSFNAIGLYPNYAQANENGVKDYSALCVLDDRINTSSSSDSSSLVVDWELIISNKDAS